jgi:hypothetical protein
VRYTPHGAWPGEGVLLLNSQASFDACEVNNPGRLFRGFGAYIPPGLLVKCKNR